MLPMRSIPFQVIALLGMNEGEFPKIDRHPTFDLLGHNFRKGDRSRRADDRYQFLEILLSARQQLIITYIGQSINNNEPIQPSVIISELLEVLQENYQLRELITRHPLQAFSYRYFTDNEKLFSYSEVDCITAMSLYDQTQKHTVPVWWNGKLPDEHQTVIDLHDLFAFYRHPQKYFVQNKLSVYLQGIETAAEEREPFQLNGLDAYQINHEWIVRQLAGETSSVQKLQAQGRWLLGISGEIEFNRREDELAAFVARIHARKLGNRRDDPSIDIHVGDYRLLGKLSNLYQQGGLFFRYANLKGSDLLQALLHHLIINRLLTQTTCLLSKDDEDIVFTPEHCQSGALEAFIEKYQQGQSHPNAFFVDPALAYIQQSFKLKYGKAKKPALLFAQENLAKAINSGYEQEMSLLYRGIDDTAEILDDKFAASCKILLEPVWEASHGQ
jgi:exodeoxyribonuclease V gamma subunit